MKLAIRPATEPGKSEARVTVGASPVRRHAAGEQLREMRRKLGVTTREVEEFSRAIAEDRQNDEFYISNAWLTQIENRDSVPGIHKLFSLSAIYRVKFSDLLKLFGVDVEAIPRFQSELPLRNTHLAEVEAPDPANLITFPVRFDRQFQLDRTSLISRMVEVWGEIPIALLQRLDMRNRQYGYIGARDYTMYPLVRPGSFVQIERQCARQPRSEWRTEFDRPIYFVEMRESYACSWCELREGCLTLVPHPLSGCTVRQFAYPDDAEILGQVTAVAMRLLSPAEMSSSEIPARPVSL